MIVITGATWNIGSKTAANLLAQGKKVKVIARNSEKLEELKKQGAEVELGNLHDSAFLTKALLEYGISESVADGFNNMYKGINAGLFNVSKRTEQSTTKTTLEDFTNNVFKYAIQ